MPAILSPSNPYKSNCRPWADLREDMVVETLKGFKTLNFYGSTWMSFRPLGEIQPGGLDAVTLQVMPVRYLVRSLVATLARDDVGVFLRRVGRAHHSILDVRS
ncbi:MAG: hypothetical protein WC647_06475 [Desulfomonilaceae bacterium]